MKNLKYLLILLAAVLVLPMAVFAEGEEVDVTAAPAEESNEVKVYFFRGEGCSHCAEAEAWFQSIEEEYGQYFEITDYEVWYNDDNAKLMEKVAKARNETAEGVPYIIIGNKSWNGFSSDWSDEIIDQIKSEFEVNVDERYDVMKRVSGEQTEKDSTSSDVLALLLILVVTGGICYGVYRARKANQ